MYYYGTLETFVSERLGQEWFHTYVMLEPTTLHEDLQEFEREFATPFPQPLSFILEHWTTGNSSLLLETLPALLNPTVPSETLTPTGLQTAEFFTEFNETIGGAQKIAIVAYQGITQEEIEYKLIGLALMPNFPDTYGIIWEYFVPQSLEWIARWESEMGITLTPQLKQMYIRANGNMSCYPFLYPLESLSYGELTYIYADIWNEVNSPEPYERLEQFVIISNNGCGDDYGFFPEDIKHHSEYPIFIWETDTASFRKYADDFVGLWNKIH
jgi:hypothetical protein